LLRKSDINVTREQAHWIKYKSYKKKKKKKERVTMDN